MYKKFQLENTDPLQYEYLPNGEVIIEFSQTTSILSTVSIEMLHATSLTGHQQ